MPSRERGHVGRLGAVEQVARGEDTRTRGAQGSVDDRTARARVELEPAQQRQLVVRDPVGREDHAVAADRTHPAAVEIGQLHLLHARAPVDGGHRRACPQRRPVAGTRAGTEERERLVLRQLGGHADRPRASVVERHQRGEAHVLGAHHERAAAQPPLLQIDELLQRPGGHHAVGARAGHEPRRARALAAAGGEDHRVGGSSLVRPARTGELERSAGRPARDHRLAHQARPRGWQGPARAGDAA